MRTALVAVRPMLQLLQLGCACLHSELMIEQSVVNFGTLSMPFEEHQPRVYGVLVCDSV